MKPECENCAEYGSEFCKACLNEKEIENEHPNCGTPDCCGECETADITEEAPAMNTGAIPNPADTVQGPNKKKKKPRVLKRFKSYVDALK